VDLKDVTILVVDDEPSVVELLSEYLRTRGHTVCIASDGIEALDRLEEGGIDVVLTDMKMPRVSGPELLQTIKQRNYPVATILMTGYGTIDSAVRSLKAGAHDYLLKPFSLRELYAALGRTVERLKLERETLRLREVTRLVQAAHEATEISPLLQRLCELASAEGGIGATVRVQGYDTAEHGQSDDSAMVLAMPIRGEARGELTVYAAPEKLRGALQAYATVVADAVTRLELQAELDGR
jgi:DNA-binding NtrC family response regulator